LVPGGSGRLLEDYASRALNRLLCSAWEIALPVTVALALLVVPTIGGASWRYAVPAEGALAVAATAAWHLAAPALPRLRLQRPAQV
jgi:hypothetical protein